MKLRIRGDSLRLRLARPEVEAVGRGERVEEVTHFPDGVSLRYRLEASASDPQLFVRYSDGLLSVRIGLQTAVRWCSSAAVEISEVVPLQSGGELRVLIEKDFECLHPNPNEDAKGAFPNPRAPRR